MAITEPDNSFVFPATESAVIGEKLLNESNVTSLVLHSLPQGIERYVLGTVGEGVDTYVLIVYDGYFLKIKQSEFTDSNKYVTVSISSGTLTSVTVGSTGFQVYSSISSGTYTIKTESTLEYQLAQKIITNIDCGTV